MQIEWQNLDVFFKFLFATVIDYLLLFLFATDYKRI